MSDSFPKKPEFLLHQGPWLIADTIRELTNEIKAQPGALDALSKRIDDLEGRVKHLEDMAKGPRNARTTGGPSAK